MSDDTQPIPLDVLQMMAENADDLYEEAPCGYVSTSLNGWIGKLNKTLLKWIGYEADELILRKRFQDLMSPGGRIFYSTHYAPLLLMQGYINEIAVDLRHKNGETVPVLVNSIMKHDAEGVPRLIRMSIFNASERRRYERELLAAKKIAEQAVVTLEQRVIERTRDLADALARAEAAAYAKSTFLTNMSHELRTPLNGILGMAHLTLAKTNDPKQRSYLENIEHSGKALLSIVSDMLDYSKIETGKLDIAQVPIDLHDIFQRAAESFAPLAQEKGLKFTVRVDPTVPISALGDPLRLSQILTNYIDNAIKFTANGSVAVHAHATVVDGGVFRLRVDVQDTGVGIADDAQKLLFKPFQQADSSTTRKFGGTGLGLAIARQLADLMGGAVGVESEPDWGSLFWFEVRLSQYHIENTHTAGPGEGHFIAIDQDLPRR